MKHNSLSFAFLLLFMTVANQEVSFKKLYPLAGTWKMEAGAKSVYENWQLKNENEMHGRSYKVTAKDTVILEDVQLTSRQNVISYNPVVTGQNGGQAVTFKLTSFLNQQFVFENPDHDFPQRVIYQLVGKDSLHAWIEGKQNGKEKRSDFYYRRLK